MTVAPQIVTPPAGIVLLNEVDHSYTIDGKPAPGVTSVIKEAGLADFRWVDDYYRERGSRAHKAMHFVGEHDLHLGSCPDEVVGYAISCANFLVVHNARPIAIERRVRSLHYWYAGTLDWIGLMDSCGDVKCCPRPFTDALTLLDWKTSKTFHPATAIQLISYADAWYEEASARVAEMGSEWLRKQLPQRRVCVLVAEDGGPARQKEYPAADHRTDRDTWRAALTCCAFRRRHHIASIYDDDAA